MSKPLKRSRQYTRIYVYWTDSSKKMKWTGPREGVGLLKVGKTRNVDANARIKQQFQGAIRDLTTEDAIDILIDDVAIDVNGNYFGDSDIHRLLKYMGIHRIPGTEWFEAKPFEILEAIELRKNTPDILTNHLPYRFKNTPESRGVVLDKKVKVKDNSSIYRYTNVTKTMMKYPDATTIVQITRHMIRDFNIVAFSESTTSIKVGSVVRQLIEQGYVVNKGTRTMPHLEVVNKSVPNIIMPHDYNTTVTTAELVKIINDSPSGITLSDLVARTNARRESIHSRLTKKLVQKVKVNSNRVHNGYEIKYFGLGKDIILTDDETLYVEKVAVKPSHDSTTDWTSYIEQMIKEKKEGIKTADIMAQVPIAKVSVRKIISNLVNSSVCLRMSTGNPLENRTGIQNVYVHIENLHPEVLTERVKKLYKKEMKFLLKHGVSDYTLLDIIQKCPGCDNETIKKELSKKLPTVSVNSWTAIVSHLTKLIEADKVIVNNGSITKPSWFIVTKEQPYHAASVINVEAVIDILKNEPYGLTISDIWVKLGDPLINNATLGLTLKSSEHIKCLLCASMRHNRPFYRVYLAGERFYRCPEDEIILDYIS